MNPTSPRRSSYGVYVATIAVLMIIAATITLLLRHNHTISQSAKQSANLSSYCVGQTFAAGGTGHCVQDIQVLASYMQSHMNELPSCKIEVSTTAYAIKITGTYDYSDKGVVSMLQSWAQCYAKQEGFTTNVKTSGNVDKPTWGELCAYGYTDPTRSHVTGASDSIAAGKDASCPLLQT